MESLDRLVCSLFLVFVVFFFKLKNGTSTSPGQKDSIGSSEMLKSEVISFHKVRDGGAGI